MNTAVASLPPAVLSRFDAGGPRYTSYPTADRFEEAFGEPQYREALHRRAADPSTPLGVYVHVPFCQSVCYYCACNKAVTRDRSRADAYLDTLEIEIALHAGVLGEGAAVSHLHLGGGTPTYLDDAQLSRLMRALQRAFHLVPGGERAIEIDPRTVDAGRLKHLAALGFDRLSFGVQDFDPQVQQAVHRVQPFDTVTALMNDARRIGFQSINVDLIYGLPKQTRESFARTLAQVGALKPDRIALYAYAHLPERFKPQRRIDAADLPPPDARVPMLGAAIDALTAGGYEYIGMDHFALAGDALAVAKRQGRLRRNFQGYSTQPDGDLIGLGVSAIGQIGATYAQNAKSLPEYAEALREGRFATARGLALQADDVLRRRVILDIMCQGRVDFAPLQHRHRVDPRTHFARELAELQPLAEQGLVALRDDGFDVTPAGWYVVRAVAMVFDRHLRDSASRTRFSRIV